MLLHTEHWITQNLGRSKVQNGGRGSYFSLPVQRESALARRQRGSEGRFSIPEFFGNGRGGQSRNFFGDKEERNTLDCPKYCFPHFFPKVIFTYRNHIWVFFQILFFSFSREKESRMPPSAFRHRILFSPRPPLSCLGCPALLGIIPICMPLRKGRGAKRGDAPPLFPSPYIPLRIDCRIVGEEATSYCSKALRLEFGFGLSGRPNTIGPF